MTKIVLVLSGIQHTQSQNSLKAIQTITQSLQKHSIKTIIAAEISQDIDLPTHIKTIEFGHKRSGEKRQLADLELSHYLTNTKLSWHGIDMPKKLMNSWASEYMVAQCSFSQEASQIHFDKWEPKRIESMKLNLLKCIHELNKSGGVILVTHHGRLHTHKLAYHVMEAFKQSNQENLELEIICLDWIPIEQRLLLDLKIAQMQTKDSEAHRKFYKETEIHRWEITTRNNGQVDCPKLHETLLNIFKIKKNDEQSNVNQSKIMIEQKLTAESTSSSLTSLSNDLAKADLLTLNIQYPFFAQDYLQHLSVLMGGKIWTEDPIQHTISFPLTWLQKVYNINPDRIEDLATGLLVNEQDKKNLLEKCKA